MRKLIVSEFVTLDGVMQAPGGNIEGVDDGFAHGGWVMPLFDEGVGAHFGELTKNADAVLLGRHTYIAHAGAFEPDPAEDPFDGLKKYVVTTTLTESLWRDTEFIRGDALESIRALKAQPGKDIVTDGSSQLVHAMLEEDLVDELYLLIFPITVGGGIRVFPDDVHQSFKLTHSKTTPNGIVILQLQRVRTVD